MQKMTIPCDVLSGSRVRLRPFDAKEDAERLFAICSKDENVRYYGMTPMVSAKAAESLLLEYARGMAAGTSVHWAIVSTKTGEIIGDAGLMSIDSRNGRASSYCILDSRYWGRGLSAEAMKIIFDHAFSRSDLNRIQAFIDARNVRTLKSVTEIGFVKEGVLRGYEIDRGEYIDDAVFAITRSDWAARRHVIFGAEQDFVREISWQRYELGGVLFVWIFACNNYHLLSGVDADNWLHNPHVLSPEESRHFRKTNESEFVTRLADAKIPYEIHWDVTYGCNSCCVHCYNPGAQDGKRACGNSEISMQECKEILARLREVGVFRIVFSGGEPFTKKGFFDLLVRARTLGFQVAIYTNGLCIDDEFADRLSRLGVMSVGVSLYGSSAAVHDAIAGVIGAHSRSVRALQLLTSHGVHTVAKCVALHDNVSQVEEMVELGRKIAKHSIVNYVFYPPIDGSHQASIHMLRMRDLISLALNRNMAIYFGCKSCQLCRYQPERVKVCYAGTFSLYLNPFGYVFPCIAIPQSAGYWREYLRNEPRLNNATHDVVEQWRNLSFVKISGCGSYAYCKFCYSTCIGDGYVINGNANIPPTNHCRLAIARYAADRWVSKGFGREEWRCRIVNEGDCTKFLQDLGIEKEVYAIDGML